jgi:hypothetical protein
MHDEALAHAEDVLIFGLATLRNKAKQREPTNAIPAGQPSSAKSRSADGTRSSLEPPGSISTMELSSCY